MLPIAAEDLLPQKFPFRMVDALIELDDSSMKSMFTIHADNVMIENEEFTVGGMLENMAQTMAAASGYLQSSLGNEPPRGYIGAIKKVKINTLPKVGDQIQTHATTLHTIGDASIVEAKIFLGEDLLASAELTIFVATKN